MRAKGMTYVELLVVAVVAGVLATVAIPTGLVAHRAWEERKLKRSLHRIRVAIDDYHRDWENGCIESDDEKGWPSSLEELTEEKELADDPQCTGAGPATTPATARPIREEPAVKRYLIRIPPDPFNDEGDEHDTAGWNARSYDDEPDATSWKGDAVYDIRSSSPLRALDETRYEEW